MKPVSKAEARRGFRSREHRRLLDLCLAHGWSVGEAGSGHLHLRSPDKQHRIMLSKSAYDGPAGTAHVRREMRAAGIVV